jgi:4-hydroxyphenylacetate 3-monooxygenase
MSYSPTVDAGLAPGTLEEETSVSFADPIVDTPRDDYLLTGDEFRASLRDGRRVIAPDGTDVSDVTTHPQLAPAIDTLAEYYDAHFDDATAPLLTYQDEESGRLASLPWALPRTTEDLERKREVNRFLTYHTMGVFGRPPDYAMGNPLGLLSLGVEIGEMRSEWRGNVGAYVRWGRENNVIEADLGVDMQADRTVPIHERPGRLRVVEERADGIVIHGAKSCNSISAQAHCGTVITFSPPDVPLDTIVFCFVPMNAEGITTICREPVTPYATNEEDHPLDSRGEEIDAVVFFDHVFVPHEHVFSWGKREMLYLYQQFGAFCLWHILSRIAYKAELMAGTARVITEVLGTGAIPQVRDSVTEIVAYSQTLKAFVLAAEHKAKLKNGLLVPNEEYITPGRLHSVTHLPRMLQLLRELSGQGVISRVTQAQWSRADIGPLLDEYTPGVGVSARTKNKLFNFVWDLSCGAHASRVALFENVNATPAAVMRAHIYGAGYHAAWADRIREFVGADLAAAEVGG